MPSYALIALFSAITTLFIQQIFHNYNEGLRRLQDAYDDARGFAEITEVLLEKNQIIKSGNIIGFFESIFKSINPRCRSLYGKEIAKIYLLFNEMMAAQKEYNLGDSDYKRLLEKNFAESIKSIENNFLRLQEIHGFGARCRRVISKYRLSKPS